MRDPTVARNYASALIEAAEADDRLLEYGELLQEVASVLAAEPGIRLMLESPRVTKVQKLSVIRASFEPIAPAAFVRFLEAVVRRGRQRLLGEMNVQYQALLDVKFNRIHASVAIARAPDEALKRSVAERLSAIIGKEVIPHFRVDERILGGLIVRVGDEVFDGSLRRRLLMLRRAMLEGQRAGG